MAASTMAMTGIGAPGRIARMLWFVGGAILLIGFLLSTRELWFQFLATRTTGIYRDSHGEIDAASGKPNILYMVTFKAKDGKEVQFMDQLLGEPLPDGKPLPVFYNPLYPQDARFVEPVRWEMAMKLLIVGLVMAGVGSGVAVLGRNKQRLHPAPETPTAPAA